MASKPIKYVTANDFRAIGYKGSPVTGWFANSQHPERDGQYQVVLKDGTRMRLVYSTERRIWTDSKGRRVGRSLIEKWRGLTRKGMLAQKKLNAAIDDGVELTAFPSIPTDAVFARMAAQLGPSTF